MRAEGASQKPVNSGVKEHAACKDLMIPKVLSLIWNMNAALSRSKTAWLGAVGKTVPKLAPWPLQCGKTLAGNLATLS
jgi:hypothetical protein